MVAAEAVGVDRHADQSGHHDREIRDEPFGAVLGQDRDAIARPVALRQQAAGEAPRLRVDLAPR
jgi:hypothetical protein